MYILGQGGKSDPRALALDSRRRNHIRNETRLEISPEMRRIQADHLSHIFPEAKLLSSSALYNCFGLVFGSRRTWIDHEAIQEVLEDDDFGPCPLSPSEWEPGDVVLYRAEGKSEITHVAILMQITAKPESASYEITVLSKWGEHGEYLHPLEHTPHFHGRFSQVWTQRLTL